MAKYWRVYLAFCGHSYKGSTIINYNSRVVPYLKMPHIRYNSGAEIYDRYDRWGESWNCSTIMQQYISAQAKKWFYMISPCSVNIN